MKTQILKKIYRVVLYLRLSSDGGDNKESDSMVLCQEKVQIKYALFSVELPC